MHCDQDFDCLAIHISCSINQIKSVRWNIILPKHLEHSCHLADGADLIADDLFSRKHRAAYQPKSEHVTIYTTPGIADIHSSYHCIQHRPHSYMHQASI